MYIYIGCVREHVLKGKAEKIYTKDTTPTMQLSTIFHTLFLCLVNVAFMVAGIFLNSVVIISLRRSSQLRKKLCYFMILVLSYFDLAVVVINHPVLILSTIFWSVEPGYKIIKITRTFICLLLSSFSMLALLTLNMERFLALKYPFFHQAAVTKRRLLLFMALLVTTEVALSPLLYFYAKIIGNIFKLALALTLFFVFIFLNYKMFIIAKSKREVERAASNSTATSSYQERKKHKLSLNNISTRYLAVGCFLVCLFPHIIYSALSLILETPWYNRQILLFHIWCVTFISLNSTINCLIFFWRNSILRREGMKTVKRFRNENS